MRKVATTLVAVLLFGAGSSFAVTVDFDTGWEGFVDDGFDLGTGNNLSWQNNPGAGGDHGWVGTIVTLDGVGAGPGIGFNKGTNTDFAGDWVTKYGEGGTILRISVDVYCDQALPTFNGINPRIITNIPAPPADWVYDGLGAGSLAAGWTRISTTIDTSWTNAQATAAGWRQIQAGSWSNVASDVSHFEVKYHRIAIGIGNLPEGAMYGYDNISIKPPALLGDVNDDRYVDGYDLTQIIHNWGMGSAFREDGDLSGNGSVGTEDYNEVTSHWGDGTPPEPPSGAIPEPAVLSLLLIGSLALLKRKRLA